MLSINNLRLNYNRKKIKLTVQGGIIVFLLLCIYNVYVISSLELFFALLFSLLTIFVFEKVGLNKTIGLFFLFICMFSFYFYFARRFVGQGLYLYQSLIFIVFFLFFSFSSKGIDCKLYIRSKDIYFVIWFCLIALFFALSNFINLNDLNMNAWYRYYQLLGLFLFSFSLFLIIRLTSDEFISYMVFGVFISVFVYLLIIGLKWFSLEDPTVYDWVRGTPFFLNIRHLAHFLCISFSVSLFCFFYFSGVKAYLSVFIIFISFFLIFWSGTRAGVVALIGGFIICSLLFPFKSRLKKYAVLLFIMLFSLYLSSFFQVYNNSLGFFSAYERSLSSTNVNNLSSSRIDIWTRSFEFIMIKPSFGWGGEGFFETNKDQFSVIQVHNIFLQVLIEWGLVGFILVFMLVFKVYFTGLYVALLNNKKDYICNNLRIKLGLIIATVLLILGLFDGVFYYNLTIMWIGISLALICSGYERATETLK